MMTLTEAGFALARILIEHGYDPRAIDQVDAVLCEDNATVMVYAYLRGSDQPFPVSFDLAGEFDRQRVEAALLPDTRRMH